TRAPHNPPLCLSEAGVFPFHMSEENHSPHSRKTFPHPTWDPTSSPTEPPVALCPVSAPRGEPTRPFSCGDQVPVAETHQGQRPRRQYRGQVDQERSSLEIGRASCRGGAGRGVA